MAATECWISDRKKNVFLYKKAFVLTDLCMTLLVANTYTL